MDTQLRSIVAELLQLVAGQAHRAREYVDEEAWCKKALSIQTDIHRIAELHNLAMYACALQHKFDEAIRHATFAMKAGEKFSVGPRYIRTLLYLMKGDYQKGFAELECRWDERGVFNTLGDNYPKWDGRQCKVLHVFGEQGYGDIFQFSRYVPLLKDKFGIEKIYWEVPPSCRDLFVYNYRPFSEIEVITKAEREELAKLSRDSDGNWIGSKAGGFDWTIQHMSLAYFFGTTFETVPPIKILPEPTYVEKWKGLDKKVIGVCFGGRPNDGNMLTAEWNSRRNVDPEQFFKVIAGRPFILLQNDKNPEIKSWSDTAGIIANCKMVLTVDSGPVHLAAAMDCCPVWLLSHKQKCWRWMGSPTPWYSSKLRQFDQTKEGVWDDVLAKVWEEMGKECLLQ